MAGVDSAAILWVGAPTVARDRGGRHIADVAVRVRLHPGPALVLLEHADGLAEQQLRRQRLAGIRRAEHVGNRDAHLPGPARDESRGRDAPFEARVGKVGAIGVEARIGRALVHAFAQLRRQRARRTTSNTARAACGSPPFGPIGRGAGRQP